MSKVDNTPSKQCAKCDSDNLIFVEAIRGSFGSGNVIPLSGLFIFDSVKVDRYVCTSCGFCEEWITNPEDRAHLRRWYQPGSRRACNNNRRRRWGQWIAKIRRRWFGDGSADQRLHGKVHP